MWKTKEIERNFFEFDGENDKKLKSKQAATDKKVLNLESDRKAFLKSFVISEQCENMNFINALRG